MILTTIVQEKERIEYMLTKYREEYDRLPKGSISEKKAGDKTYYYLKYRDGKKVASQYISKSRIDEIRAQIEKRKHIEALKIKKRYNQLVLTSPNALSYLKYVGTVPKEEF